MKYSFFVFAQRKYQNILGIPDSLKKICLEPAELLAHEPVLSKEITNFELF
mgnify:CR=1 FL=1